MKKLLLLVGLVVFLMPTFTNAEDVKIYKKANYQVNVNDAYLDCSTNYDILLCWVNANVTVLSDLIGKYYFAIEVTCKNEFTTFDSRNMPMLQQWESLGIVFISDSNQGSREISMSISVPYNAVKIQLDQVTCRVSNFIDYD